MNNRLDNLLEVTLRLIHESTGKNQFVYCTSSFQTQSLPLLHIVSQNFPYIKIIFIDTGYLFPETYAFKDQLAKTFVLDLITIKSKTDYINQISGGNGLPLYCSDLDKCCYINKVEPVEKFFKNGDVWISGVRKDQTGTRQKMKVCEVDNNGVIRLHPMLNWTSKDIASYIKKFDLPSHPLEKEGYLSIGCVPCTNKWDGKSDRNSRWLGSMKNECGLHLIEEEK